MKSIYPDDDELISLKEILGNPDFLSGAAKIAEMIRSTGYGRATLDEKNQRLEIATGGWSGCEEIIDAINGSLWDINYWQSTHRGGLHVWQNRRGEK